MPKEGIMKLRRHNIWNLEYIAKDYTDKIIKYLGLSFNPLYMPSIKNIPSIIRMVLNGSRTLTFGKYVDPYIRSLFLSKKSIRKEPND